MTERYTTIRIRPLTAKVLKLWLATYDLAEADSVNAAIRRVVPRMAGEAGLSEALDAACRASRTAATAGETGAEATAQDRLDALGVDLAGRKNRRLQLRLDEDAERLLRIGAALLDVSQSELADRAILRHVTELVPPDAWETFAAMVLLIKWEGE